MVAQPPGVGRPLSERDAPGPGEGPMRLVVRRDRGWNDVLRRYRILVDGVQVGHLWRGDTLDVELAPGVHTVEARIDWCGSRPITVAGGPGERVVLEVRNGLDGWRGVLVFVAVFVRTHEYLLLDHVEGGARPPQRTVD